MSKSLVVLPEAEEELRAALRWYEAKRPGLGLELIGVVDQALAAIAAMPHRFPVWAADTKYRRAVLRRFPYVVVFEDREDTVEVVALAHVRRRPGYWRERPQR
jgi:plasmid stabilization system protein ParE